MNKTTTVRPDPFALMMNPDAVLHAMACSERLARLHSRVCRPLDKPLIPRVNNDLAAFDREVDAANDDELLDDEPADLA